MYQISGKFTTLKDNSFNVIITTSIRLHIGEDYILISKPVAHLIGNTTNNATSKTIFITYNNAHLGHRRHTADKINQSICNTLRGK